jgi:hypothetical protein
MATLKNRLELLERNPRGKSGAEMSDAELECIVGLGPNPSDEALKQFLQRHAVGVTGPGKDPR